MIGLLKKHRFFKAHELKSSYDVIIIGAGAHGLATAYYLAKNHGVKNIAVLDKSYMGAGGSGRNTTIIRSNYLTPEGALFYEASVKLYENLSKELNFNTMFSQHGHLTLAHSDRSVNTMMERAEVNRLVGVDSRVVYPDEIKELCPQLDTTEHPTFPILAALYHPPGGDHPPRRGGVGLRQGVGTHGRRDPPLHRGHRHQHGGRQGHRGRDQPRHHQRRHGDLVHGRVEQRHLRHGQHPAAADHAHPPGLRDRAGQAAARTRSSCSGTLHIYISQSDRGEFVMGSEIEPYSGYSTKGTFRFIEDLAMHMIELLPMLGEARILRQWTGLCDVSPDYSPIMGETEVDGFVVDAGWGTYGFKASPIVGHTIAELVASKKTPQLIEPFKLSRFYEDRLVSERGAAAVSH